MQNVHAWVIRSAVSVSLLMCLGCLLLTSAASPAEAAGAATLAGAAAPVEGSAPPGECRVSPRYPESIRQWCALITIHAEQTGLSPDLLAALIWLESGGDALAYSRSGAVGLMQVMPRDGLAASFTCVNGPCFADRPTIAELQDPDFNVSYGSQMLAGLTARHGNLRDALKSYGPMDVGYDYADRVLGIYDSYRQE